MPLNSENRFRSRKNGSSFALSDSVDQFTKDSRFLDKDSVHGRKDKLHELSVAIENFDDIEEGIHISITLVVKHILLSFLILLGEL